MLYDKDIREPLFDFLEETYGKIRIIEEKTTGKSRADIVMVAPDALYGIEIKSDADTYARLGSQIKDYDQYYDYNIVAVGSSHGLHISEHVPDYWGIITVEEVDGEINLYFLRKPGMNPRMKWERKLSILWRTELALLQEWNDMPKYKDKSKRFVCQKINERIPQKISEEKLKYEISELLFERDYNNVELMMEWAKKRQILAKNQERKNKNRRSVVFGVK